MPAFLKWQLYPRPAQAGAVNGHDHLQRLGGILPAARRLALLVDRREPIFRHAPVGDGGAALLGRDVGVFLPPDPLRVATGVAPLSLLKHEHARVDVGEDPGARLAPDELEAPVAGPFAHRGATGEGPGDALGETELRLDLVAGHGADVLPGLARVALLDLLPLRAHG